MFLISKIVIGLSGGMDSTTLLGFLLSQGYEVHCCIFDYGSKHSKYEQRAAWDVLKYYDEYFPGVYQRARTINLKKVFAGIESNLLKSGGEIPEGHFEAEIMKSTVVPGRNLIFGSIMLGIAESLEAEAIGLGVHGGDHAIYPDCRPEFIKALELTAYLSTAGKVTVLAPFLEPNPTMCKANILRMGYRLPLTVPYHLTRTCYKDQVVACGACGSCQERLEAFKEVGIDDPLIYDNL